MNKVSTASPVLFGEISIPGDIALEICAQSCLFADSFASISRVSRAFHEIINSDPFWKRLWELYAGFPSSSRLCAIICQQFAPATSLKAAVILVRRCIKDTNILLESAWQTVFTNKNKTIDARLLNSNCGITQELPPNTAGLTAMNNPQLMFLPSLPSTLTYATSINNPLLRLPQLQHLTQLKTLIVEGSKLTQVNLRSLLNLEKVSFSRNLITAFTVEDCPHLKEVNLASNQLEEVPSTLADLPALKELKLANNPIKKQPKWLKKIQHDLPHKTCFWGRLKKTILG